MFGPDYSAGCPSCSAIADGFNGSAVHLANHDVTLSAVSRAPFAKIDTYKRRMGWTFPWASSYGSDFNFDFGAAHTRQEWQSGTARYNFGAQDLRPAPGQQESMDAFSQSIVGTDWETYRSEGHRVPHLLGVLPRAGRPVGHVPVARPRSARPQRGRHVVAPPRRVRQPVSRG
jgi:predicted dithiol-disulfide oxidoreductase (DUF899 family)